MHQANEPDISVDLDIRAMVTLVDDGEGLGLLLADDGGVVVRIAIPRNADAWLHLKSLARRIESYESEVRRKTIGYQHGPHTGPGAYR